MEVKKRRAIESITFTRGEAAIILKALAIVTEDEVDGSLKLYHFLRKEFDEEFDEEKVMKHSLDAKNYYCPKPLDFIAKNPITFFTYKEKKK